MTCQSLSKNVTCKPSLEKLVGKLFEVMSKLDWGSIINLKLQTNFIDAGVSIASGIAAGFGDNQVKTILGGGVGFLLDILKLKLAMNLVGLGGSGAAAGGAIAGSTSGSTGILGGLATGLAPLAPFLGSAAAIAGSAAFLIYGYLAGKDPEVQRKIEEGKAALSTYREDETKNWESHYKGLYETADEKSNDTFTTIETANGKIKESYDSLGRKIGEVVDGDFSSDMSRPPRP